MAADKPAGSGEEDAVAGKRHWHIEFRKDSVYIPRYYTQTRNWKITINERGRMNHTIYQEKIQETLSRLPVFQQERIYRLVRLWVNHLTADKQASLEDLLSLAGSWEDERSAEQIIEALQRDRRSTDRGQEAF
jgi:hypothetical protein